MCRSLLLLKEKNGYQPIPKTIFLLKKTSFSSFEKKENSVADMFVLIWCMYLTSLQVSYLS
jgi:hypothetical protein